MLLKAQATDSEIPEYEIGLSAALAKYLELNTRSLPVDVGGLKLRVAKKIRTWIRSPYKFKDGEVPSETYITLVTDEIDAHFAAKTGEAK